MKIALIVIAYLLLGCASVLGFMLFEYRTEYSHHTLEYYYTYEVKDEEMLYLVIALFWPVVDIGLFIYFGFKALIKSFVHLMNYILNGGNDEEE